MDFQEPQNNSIPCKMDILFYNSIKKAGKLYFRKSIYHFVKALIFIIFLPIDISVLETTEQLIVIFMGVAIGISILNMLISIAVYIGAYSNTEENNNFFMNMAEATEHVVTNEPLDQKSLQKLEQCASAQMYNASNQTTLDSEGLTEEIKSRYEDIMSSIIQENVMSYSQCLSFLDSISKFLGLGVLIFGIVALAKSQPSAAEIAVVVVYLVLECIHIITILLILLAIALSPVLCCFFCILLCCCNTQNSQLRLPQEVLATPKLIMEGDGSCSICLQAIKKDEGIIILPCSHKHMFHTTCITNWVKVRPNCPICRHRLDQ